MKTIKVGDRVEIKCLSPSFLTHTRTTYIVDVTSIDVDDEPLAGIHGTYCIKGDEPYITGGLFSFTDYELIKKIEK